MSKDSSINNVKFNIAQIFQAPKISDDEEEETKAKDAEEAKPPNNTPLALCVFLPEPIPEENDEEIPEPTTQEPDLDNQDNEKLEN